VELRDLQNSVINCLEDKLHSKDLKSFGLEYQLKGNLLMFAIDRYYIIALKKAKGRIFIRAKTMGMKLESDWFLVLDEDRLLQRVVKLLLMYLMKDRDVRN
jgi:hypothetical protein